MSFFIGTLVVGDPAYKMLAMFFSRNGFQLAAYFAYVYAVGICTSFQYVFYFWVVGEFWEVKVFILLYFLWFRRRIDAYRN
jgi:hypothetical protein